MWSCSCYRNKHQVDLIPEPPPDSDRVGGRSGNNRVWEMVSSPCPPNPEFWLNLWLLEISTDSPSSLGLAQFRFCSDLFLEGWFWVRIRSLPSPTHLWRNSSNFCPFVLIIVHPNGAMLLLVQIKSCLQIFIVAWVKWDWKTQVSNPFPYTDASSIFFIHGLSKWGSVQRKAFLRLQKGI